MKMGRSGANAHRTTTDCELMPLAYTAETGNGIGGVFGQSATGALWTATLKKSVYIDKPSVPGSETEYSGC